MAGYHKDDKLTIVEGIQKEITREFWFRLLEKAYILS